MRNTILANSTDISLDEEAGYVHSVCATLAQAMAEPDILDLTNNRVMFYDFPYLALKDGFLYCDGFYHEGTKLQEIPREKVPPFDENAHDAFLKAHENWQPPKPILLENQSPIWLEIEGKDGVYDSPYAITTATEEEFQHGNIYFLREKEEGDGLEVVTITAEYYLRGPDTPKGYYWIPVDKPDFDEVPLTYKLVQLHDAEKEEAFFKKYADWTP